MIFSKRCDNITWKINQNNFVYVSFYIAHIIYWLIIRTFSSPNIYFEEGNEWKENATINLLSIQMGDKLEKKECPRTA